MKDREPRISNDARAIVSAIDRFSENTGKCLGEIAEALASDDAEAIKLQAERIRASREALEQSVNNQPQT